MRRCTFQYILANNSFQIFANVVLLWPNIVYLLNALLYTNYAHSYWQGYKKILVDEDVISCKAFTLDYTELTKIFSFGHLDLPRDPSDICIGADPREAIGAIAPLKPTNVTVTDLCIGQIGHGLGPRATLSYDDLILTKNLRNRAEA